MSYLLLLLSVGALIWLGLLVHSLIQRTPKSTEQATINPRVNLGKAAGVHSIQGQRAHMEDTYYGDHTKAFFGVYDGHGGSRASQYTAQHLHDLVLQHNVCEHPRQALTEGFKALDRHWLELANLNSWDDGTTAVVVMVVNKTLYVANAGDSRAVLASRGKAVDMSVDHKPNRPDERERIEKLGGRIIHYGTWRVEGVLAVTRAVGDRRLKKYVTAEPEIRERKLEEGDDFLILATDGVWDVTSSQSAVDIVMKSRNDVREAAAALTTHAYNQHSLDNITSLVVDLRCYR